MQCLEFNPYLRASPTECLASQAFDIGNIKEKHKTRKSKFLLEIDKEEAFDYEKGTSLSFDMAGLKDMI